MAPLSQRNIGVQAGVTDHLAPLGEREGSSSAFCLCAQSMFSAAETVMSNGTGLRDKRGLRGVVSAGLEEPSPQRAATGAWHVKACVFCSSEQCGQAS